MLFVPNKYFSVFWKLENATETNYPQINAHTRAIQDVIFTCKWLLTIIKFTSPEALNFWLFKVNFVCLAHTGIRHFVVKGNFPPLSLLSVMFAKQSSLRVWVAFCWKTTPTRSMLPSLKMLQNHITPVYFTILLAILLKPQISGFSYKFWQVLNDTVKHICQCQNNSRGFW